MTLHRLVFGECARYLFHRFNQLAAREILPAKPSLRLAPTFCRRFPEPDRPGIQIVSCLRPGGPLPSYRGPACKRSFFKPTISETSPVRTSPCTDLRRTKRESARRRNVIPAVAATHLPAPPALLMKTRSEEPPGPLRRNGPDRCLDVLDPMAGLQRPPAKTHSATCQPWRACRPQVRPCHRHRRL